MTSQTSPPPDSTMMASAGPLAIIAGAGAFPAAAADRLIKEGRAVFILALQGIADRSVERFPHRWVRIAAFGTMVATARARGCRDLTLIGSLTRPSILSSLPDLGTLLRAPRILHAYAGGDDHLLRGIVRLFEAEGFCVVGMKELVPDLLAPLGPFGRVAAEAQDIADITRGLAALDHLGQFDIGQALVISRGHIVAVEGAEGTDGLLDRVAAMRKSGRISWRGQRGILVKAPKPGQDLRIDLPAVGPRTIDQAIAANLAGVAVRAGNTLMIDLEEASRKADKAGMFFQGVGGAS